MAYASWSVTFGEQPSAAKWNILGTNDASFNDGTGIANGSILPNHLKASASSLNTYGWDTWTPTFTNITVGNGTLTGKYIQIGKNVNFRLALVFGTTTSVAGTVTLTLPVTAASHAGSVTHPPFGLARILDFGTASYVGTITYNSTTSAIIQVSQADATYLKAANLSSTIPMTWTSTDELHALGTYEAA